MTSPCQRSLQLLRAEGWHVAIVERWNQWARVRQDLFGFADLLALKSDTILAVQTTSAANFSARVTKISETQAARLWLESPARKIEIHGWKKPTKTRRTWEVRREQFTFTPL